MESESAAVRGALCRVLRVMRCFGIAPLRFTRRHTVTIVRVWNAQLYYGYFLATILNVMMILSALVIIVFPRVDHKNRDVTLVGLALLAVNLGSSMLIVSGAAYGASTRMKYLLLQLNQLNKITILIPSESIIREEKKRTVSLSLGILILLSAYVVVDLGIMVGNGIYINPTIFEVITPTLFSATYAQFAMVILLELQIVLVICAMHAAVESFNQELKRLHDAVIKGNEAASFKLKESLWRLNRYYLALCENIRRMNSREGALMLLLMVFLILQLMNNSYRFILALSSIDRLQNLGRYLYTTSIRFVCTVIYVIMVGLLVNTCDRIQTEIQKMRHLMSELMYRRRGEGGSIAAAAAALCEQLSIHQPIFKPLAICALTRSLFVTVITGVITYLVSVVKFHTMEESFQKV